MAALATALATGEDLDVDTEGHLSEERSTSGDVESDPYGFFEGWKAHSVSAKLHAHQTGGPSFKNTTLLLMHLLK